MATLYIGNLSEFSNEIELAKVFGKFGRILQIKVMQPRQDETRAGNFCAFIKFEDFASAYLAKKHLNERKLLN